MVLVHYRSYRSIQPCRMVPAASVRVPRAPTYSGFHWASREFRLRGLHPLRRAFQCASTIPLTAISRSYYPDPKIGLGASGFARHYSRNHFCFLLLQVLRCFNSLGCTRQIMYWSEDVTALPVTGSPIRISPDRCLFTTPRGVSPFAASFFCSVCQDIHRTLFFI